MLDAIIVLLSFYGLTYVIKEAEILSRPRQWVMEHSTFMAKMLYCWFCTGFHAGWIVYLLHEIDYSWRLFICWGLASATISYILNIAVTRLSWEKEN
jgi:hypothetical protein